MRHPLQLLATTLLGSGLLLWAPSSSAAVRQDSGDSGAVMTKELEAAFAQQGIRLDVGVGLCAIPVQVCIRQELLEYVLVSSYGAAHESLFATGVSPTVLNTALMAVGAKKGENVRWIEKDPPPTEEELRKGASTYDVLPPTGEGFFLYVAWIEDGETYFFRLEDLITNIERGRCMQRHEWVYLGSRMVQPEPDSDERVLAAEMEGNLINLSYFRAGNTIFTAALDACVHQTIWVPNTPLIPEEGAAVTMVFSQEKLRVLPESVATSLVDIRGQ